MNVEHILSDKGRHVVTVAPRIPATTGSSPPGKL